MENGFASEQEEWSDVPTDVADGIFDATFLPRGVELADSLGRDTALEAGEDADDEIFACAAVTSGEEARVSERGPLRGFRGPISGLRRIRISSSGGRAWLCVMSSGAV